MTARRFYVEITETIGYYGDTRESVWSLCKYKTAGPIQFFDSVAEAENAAEDYVRYADNETMGGYPVDYAWEVLEAAD